MTTATQWSADEPTRPGGQSCCSNVRGDQSSPPRRPAPAPALLLIYTRLTISLQGPTLPTSLLHGRSDKEQPENSVLISVSRRGEQGGADTSTHQDSEKPDEIAQWFNATETCAPQAYRVLMSKPDFAAPLAPRNLAIFDDALEHYGALDSLYENDMLQSVPVAPGEQSNYEQAIAARRMYKQSQRASAQHWRADSAAVAVASWRRRV